MASESRQVIYQKVSNKLLLPYVRTCFKNSDFWDRWPNLGRSHNKRGKNKPQKIPTIYVLLGMSSVLGPPLFPIHRKKPVKAL